MTDAVLQDDAEPDSPTGPVFDIDMRAAPWQPFIDDLRAHMRYLTDALALPAVEISLVLGDDALLATLNEEYRGKAGPTNVLSFPALDMTPQDMDRLMPGALLGDVVMSFDTLAREAQAGEKSLTAHALHLLTHGVLHLLGHDHMHEAQAREMETLETALLTAVGLDDPYGDQQGEAVR